MGRSVSHVDSCPLATLHRFPNLCAGLCVDARPLLLQVVELLAGDRGVYIEEHARFSKLPLGSALPLTSLSVHRHAKANHRRS